MQLKELIKQHKIFLLAVISIIVIILTWTFINSFSEDVDDSAWDGIVANSFTSGTGTTDNPFIISNASEYAYFKSLLESADASMYIDKHYSLADSFNYGEYDLSINNAIPFSGTLDGNGHMIYNSNMTKPIFNEIKDATIKNLNLNNLTITANSDIGVLANSIENSKLLFVIFNGVISRSESNSTDVVVSGISSIIKSTEIDKVIVNNDASDEVVYYSLGNEITDISLKNVLVRNDYNNYPDTLDVDDNGLYEFSLNDDNISVDKEVLNNFINDEYKIKLENNIFNIVSLEETLNESKKNNVPRRSAAINLHDSGIDTTNGIIYINDLTIDENYYKGLNYTKISNTNGTIPDGSNQNIYSDSNLVKVYIHYTGADINDNEVYGTVSVDEQIKDYYYYKIYPVVNGYVTFDLIDSPWANRPSDRAFNGWVTDDENAIISLDMDTYTRSVKIPVSDVSNPISITFYSSWTTATVVTSTNNLNNLKSVGMTALSSSYGDLTIYYIRGTVNNNNRYPNSNDLYDLDGNKITGNSYCRTSGGCTYLYRNTSNTYSSSTTYYKVTPNGNNPATVEIVSPQRRAISYYESGKAAGYFVRVTSGSDNIYSQYGVKMDSCTSGTCYKLLQYSDGDLDSNTTYYYLTTRDTNIFVPASNSTNTSNISVTRPMTITGINNGTDNSSSRRIQLNNNWTLDADLRVEFITFYVDSTTTDVSNFNSGNYYYKIIGDFNNLKLGRGLKRYTNNGNTYLTATSFVGGSTSSATSLARYSLIVESGFYQNGSGVGYNSATTHRVNSYVTLGSDYDRIDKNNSSLIVYYCYAGSWASNLYNSSSSDNTYDFPSITTTIKSGTFGENEEDYAAGVYVGGRGSGTHYSLRMMIVEGGEIFNLIGGPMSDDDRASKNDIIINVKDGNINMLFGGAGVSNTVGNRIISITGGTINYGVLCGSNAYNRGNNSSNPFGKIDGDTLLYIGGDVTVGTKDDSLYNISSGDVFGAGNGRDGELDVGSVNNSNVIIDRGAKIKGNVYGGGNFGAVGGSAVGTSGSAVTNSGVYEDATTDNNIRYFGANPDNYIQFNGEIYRIVGLFNNVSTNNGNKNLVRIIKNTSLGNRAWGDTNSSTVQTNTSTETSEGFFADNTYNYTNYYKNYYNFYVKNDNATSNLYNYLNTTYYNGLNNTYKNYIEEVTWGLGATNGIDQTASQFYTAERGNGVVNYLTGVNQTSNGSSLSSASFKVGLFYPSDYGFANKDTTCLGTNLGSYTSSCTDNNWMSGMTNAWTITPSTDVYNVTKTYQVNRTGSIWSGYTYTMNRYYHVVNRNFIINANNALALRDIYYTNNDNDANNYYNTNAVYPSFYLKDNVTIVSGTGTQSDPYIIGESDDKLTDIVYEIMHPPVVEPGNLVHDESEYNARTNIKILGGTISGSVFGAGNSNGAGNNTNNAIALSKINIDMLGGTVNGSIYGGANSEGRVYGDVFVNVINGEVKQSVYGGGKGGYVDEDNEGTYVSDNVSVKIGDNTTTDLKIKGNVYGGSAFGTVNALDEETTTSQYSTSVTVNAGVITGSVFGGGQGNDTYTPKVVGGITTTINGGDMTSVFGGNDQAGVHTEANYVYLNGGVIGSVYGGGNKSSVTNTHVYQDGATVTNLYGGSNSLGDVSSTDVKIRHGSVGNVYGGNNEGGTCSVTNVLVEGDATVLSSVYGGGNQVDTVTTNITLNSANSSIANVFGGGNNASVTTSNITENGVTVGNMFGGSNSTGTVTTSNINYNNGTTTSVFGGNNAGGNTLTANVNIAGGTITTLYGGGNQANGDISNITVTGGTCTTIFGGGNSAGLSESHVTITSGTATDIYGGSNNNGKVLETEIIVNNTSSVINNIYGGGNKAEVGDTNVIVNNGTIGNIFGGGNLAQCTGDTLVDINGGTINTNVYGGGNFGVVKGSSEVTITDATIKGSAYAGGNGSTATLEGNTNITVDGDSVIGTSSSVSPTSGCVFGGGNQAFTGVESNKNSTSNVNIVGGTIYGNVYGGANTSVIYGNTIVNIGKTAITSNELKQDDIYIKGHIFGGGEANASGSEIYDWSFISVTEGVNITIDADTYTNFDIDGSFFGGGNASTASGDSYLTIRNYGNSNNPARNVSIQRVTYATLDNTNILLKGAIDRANEYNKTSFAISRVDSLTLQNNTSIYFVTGTNLLKEFNSKDANGNIAAVTIDEDNNTLTKNVDNRVYIFTGENVNVATDQQANDCAEVHGMSFLGIFNYDNDGNVNTGLYDKQYNPGDTLDWSGTFPKGSYVKGLHTKNHDIKVNGFYSNFINDETAINEVKYVVPTPEVGSYYMWFVGENVIEYNIDLIASKYSTLGTVETTFLELSEPNTSLQILSFESVDIAPGISLVDKSEIPRIASSETDANTKFGLSIEASNTGWLTSGKTSFYTREPSIGGVTYYEGENTTESQTLLFYLHHSKNISEKKDLGTVRISVMTITKESAIHNEVKRLVVNVHMSTELFQTTEYEGAMTPGDKYELFMSTTTNLTTKSKFSAYYALYGSGTNVYKPGYHRVLTSSYVLPVGTKITMLDFVHGVPEYYYHVITASDVTAAQAEYNLQGEASYSLSMFTRMGSKSNNSNYDDALKNTQYYDGTDSSEEFIFIVDFSDTNIQEDHLNNSLLIEIRDNNEESIISVLGVQHDQLVYNLYANQDSQIEIIPTPDLNPLYIGYNDTFDVSINYQSSTLSGTLITDTQYFDSKLGVQIYLKNGDGNLVSGTDLTGAYFLMDGVKYYPDIAGYTHIKLTDKVGNARKWIIFNTENASLATGDYTFVFEAFASPDGIYYSSGTPDIANVPITIINSTYGLKPEIDDDSVIYDSSGNTKMLKFNIGYTSLLNNPNIRIAMFRRKYDEVYDTNYELVDFQDFSENELTSSGNRFEYMLTSSPSATNVFSIPFKSELLTGTYRLSFRLYDNGTLIGEVVRYIIVK